MQTFRLFEPYQDKIFHGITTAGEGDFNDEAPAFKESIKALRAEFAMGPPVYAKQMHTDLILEVSVLPPVPPIADAFITRRHGLPLMVKMADCQAILIYDKARQAVAAVHSGWRGSAQNILGKTLQALQKTFNSHPSNLLVGIGPSLGPCCSEFSDPLQELPPFAHPYFTDTHHVDFWRMSLDQATKEGVPEKNIEIARRCTRCQPGSFSHRKGDSRRMAGIIGLR